MKQPVTSALSSLCLAAGCRQLMRLGPLPYGLAGAYTHLAPPYLALHVGDHVRFLVRLRLQGCKKRDFSGFWEQSHQAA